MMYVTLRLQRAQRPYLAYWPLSGQPQPHWAVWPLEHRLSYLAHLLSSEPLPLAEQRLCFYQLYWAGLY
jgi:hypothetical protein